MQNNECDEPNNEVFERFAEWLLDSGKSASTIAKYIHYLDVISRGFCCNVGELIATDERYQQTLREFDSQVHGTGGSLQTYRSALRAYRNFAIDCEAPVNAQPIQLYDASDNSQKWFQGFAVEKASDFVGLISFLNTCCDDPVHKWVFRGQGFSTWCLESSLGRISPNGLSAKAFGAMLKQHENDSMWEFYREASKYPDYRDFRGLNLLALMQHYGCKTRLLDFSLSPLVATFMALEQSDDGIDMANSYIKVRRSCGLEGNEFSKNEIPLALWAIDLAVLNDETCRWKEFVQNSFRNGDKIVLRNANCRRAGVTVVFPEMCNRRSSAQDGLFLMSNNLELSFEKNLCAGLRLGGQFYKQEQLPPITELKRHLRTGIVKFVIDPSLRNEIRQLLTDANISEKTVYPDLVGLGKHVGNMVS